jgi:hypothetical protein
MCLEASFLRFPCDIGSYRATDPGNDFGTLSA